MFSKFCPCCPILLLRTIFDFQAHFGQKNWTVRNFEWVRAVRTKIRNDFSRTVQNFYRVRAVRSKIRNALTILLDATSDVISSLHYQVTLEHYLDTATPTYKKDSTKHQTTEQITFWVSRIAWLTIWLQFDSMLYQMSFRLITTKSHWEHYHDTGTPVYKKYSSKHQNTEQITF